MSPPISGYELSLQSFVLLERSCKVGGVWTCKCKSMVVKVEETPISLRGRKVDLPYLGT